MTSKINSDKEANSAYMDAGMAVEKNADDGDAAGSSNSDDRPHKCPECPRQYVNRKHLVRHMKIHDPNKRIKCQVCKVKVFASKGEYRLHMLTHTGEKFHQCPTCKRWFGQHGALKGHMYTHNKEKNFKCPKCPEERYFRTPAQLSDHLVLHKIEKPHECSLCPMKFHRSTDLKRHERVHTEVLPFGCVFCKKRFRYSGNLVSHVRIHTGEKFQCEQCDEGFSRANLLGAHMKVCAERMKKKKFKCPECPKRYTYKFGLIAHMKTHTKETTN